LAASHVHALYHHAEGPLHRMRPEVKLAATLAFVLAVVATPREAFWAFGVHAAVVIGVMAAGRLPPGFVLRRLLIEVPFILFAVFLPFIGHGERIDVIGLSLSREGLWAAWNILAKATLGASASVTLASTTRVADLLKGFDRLHFPRVITSIMGFMVRYLDVVVGEWNRMRVALQSRGYRPHWFGQARALGAAAGTLFVRSFERGERVYLAMQARGYDGHMPDLGEGAAPAAEWWGAGLVVLLAAGVAGLGWVLR